MGRVSGSNLRVYLGGDPIGYATTCSFSGNTEMTSVIHKDSSGNFEEVDPSTQSWGMSTSAFISEDAAISSVDVVARTALFTAWRNRTQVVLTWQDGTTGSQLLTGNAYIESIEENAEVNQTGTLTVNFKGDGDIVPTTVA